MVTLPYQVKGDGVQTIIGIEQIKSLLVSVTWKQNREVALQVYNVTQEAKFLSRKLSLVSVILFSGVVVKVGKSVRNKMVANVNDVTLREWTSKFPKLFDCQDNYGNVPFLRKMKV